MEAQNKGKNYKSRISQPSQVAKITVALTRGVRNDFFRFGSEFGSVFKITAVRFGIGVGSVRFSKTAVRSGIG